MALKIRVQACETHPQKQMIIDAILAGESVRAIAGRTTPRLHFSQIQRYKRTKVLPALTSRGGVGTLLQTKLLASIQQGNNPQVVDDTRDSLMADPIICRLEKRYRDYDDLLAHGKETKDLKGFSAVANAELRALQLQAELTGRLGQPGQGSNQTNILIMIPRVPAQPAPVSSDVEIIDVSKINT